MRYLTGLVVACNLAGCVPTPPPPSFETPPVDSCGANELQSLVGQPDLVLQTLRFAAPTRIIRPGMAVTMDYAPGRLNIEINSEDRIRAVRCG